MKYLTLFALSTFLLFQAQAQKNEVALASIKYEFIHVHDTNNKSNPRKQEMVLYLGQQGSLYKSYNSASKAAELIKQLELLGVPASDVKVKSFYTEEILTRPGADELTVLDYIGNTPFWMTDAAPGIQWQVHDEEDEIDGYPVQKATGQFRGREYTAWFTTQLPFPYGPWKLNGLPGLILKAEDSKQEVIFRYMGFEEMEAEDVAIAMPSNAVKTTANAFVKAKDAAQTNPGATVGETTFILRLNEDGSSKRYTGTEAKEIAQKAGNRSSNNPIELSVNDNK